MVTRTFRQKRWEDGLQRMDSMGGIECLSLHARRHNGGRHSAQTWGNFVVLVVSLLLAGWLSAGRADAATVTLSGSVSAQISGHETGVPGVDIEVLVAG